MSRFRFLGLLLAAAVIAGAFSAVALGDETPLNLPFKERVNIKGESEGKTELKGGITPIVCEKATGLEITEESNLPPLGKFHIHFKECKEGTETCTGSGEEAGVILSLGTWHLVWDEEKEKFELHVATLFLVEETSFTCGTVTYKVHGEQLCLDLKPEESNTKHSYHCVATNTFPITQGDSWCKKDVGGKCTELVTPKLVSTRNGITGEGFELALGNVTTEEAVAAMAL